MLMSINLEAILSNDTQHNMLNCNTKQNIFILCPFFLEFVHVSALHF